MGYTHGAQWSLEKIKAAVIEVMSAYELDRMPSRKECSNYYHNESLANAISRRMGWYELAAEMGLSIKDSETYFGKSQESIARETLVSFGYEVKQMPQNYPFDLLVNGSIKVDVKVSRLYKGPQGNFYTFNLEKPFCTCDIYLLYTIDEYQNQTPYIIPSKFVATNTQISMGEKRSIYHKYLNRWDYLEIFSAFMESVI